MTKDEWLNIIDKIDDEFIDELADYQLRKKVFSSAGEEPESHHYSDGKVYSVEEKSGFSWKRASAAIVCAAAVMLGAFFVVKNINRTKIPVDDPSSDYSSSADSGSSSSTENSSSSSSSSSESSSSSSVESSSSSSVESSSSDNSSGESNPSVTQDISAISSNDPQIGFWVALYAKENAIKAGSDFLAEISFGSRARNLERITVTISSGDFDISKSCPDEYVVDGQKYSNADFYVASSSKISPDDLPAHFTISLSPKSEKEVFSGSTEIVLEEYMVGGYSTGTVTLYYYGDSDLICFSTISQKEAESIYIAEGGKMWQTPAPASQGYYDSVFKEIALENPSTGMPFTYDEVMERLTSPKYGKLDSYYLCEAVELLTLPECEGLPGFEDFFYKLNGVKYDEVKSEGADYFRDNVFYRVKVIENLLSGEKCDYEIYTAIDYQIDAIGDPVSPIYQRWGDPPYAPGERFTLVLYNKEENSGFTRSGALIDLRLDVKAIAGVPFAFSRKRCYLSSLNIDETEKISETVIASTTGNPVTYTAKIKLSDLSDFLRKDWQKRKAENEANPGYDRDIWQIAEEYKAAGITLSDEQLQKISELYASPYEDPDWGRLLYQEGIITGEIDPNAPKLDAETAKKIISEHNDFDEILSEFEKVQCPDRVGGMGTEILYYGIDGSGGSDIAIYTEWKQIEYFWVEPDGTVQSEILFKQSNDSGN